MRFLHRQQDTCLCLQDTLLAKGKSLIDYQKEVHGYSFDMLSFLPLDVVVVPTRERKQPLDSLNSALTGQKLVSLYFYLTDPNDIPTLLRSKKPAHRDLEGLVTTSSDGKLFRTLERASLVYAGLKRGTDKWENTLSSFYVDTLGVDMTSVQAHPLIGEGSYHQWLDY